MDVTFRECAEEYLELPSRKHNRQKSPDAKLRLGTMVEEWGDIPVRDIDDRMVKSFFRKVKNFKAKNKRVMISLRLERSLVRPTITT